MEKVDRFKAPQKRGNTQHCMLRRLQCVSSGYWTEMHGTVIRSQNGAELSSVTSTALASYIRDMPKPVPLGTCGEAQTTSSSRTLSPPGKSICLRVFDAQHDWHDGSCRFNALEPFCEGDEVSVGTAINVVHRAPATVGMKITTEAVLESFDGRFYTFKVSASNGVEVIGYGTIARAIVSKAKFEEKQRQKQKALATD